MWLPFPISRLSLVVVGLCGAAPAWAGDSPLTVSASMRVRYETIDGQARVGLAERQDIVAIRTTIAAEYGDGPIRVGAELYDSRVYGWRDAATIGANEVNTIEPVQAWISADVGDTKVQAGRLMLNLGSRRLVAADDYRNTTNSYTGVRSDTRWKDGTQLTLLYMLPQTRLPSDARGIEAHAVELDRESFDAQLWGALVTRPKAFGATSVEVGYFGFAERDAPGRPTRDRRLHNIDVRVMRAPKAGAFDYEVEGIWQFGSTRTGTASAAQEQSVAAWFIHADAGYSWGGGWKPRLSVEYDRASGDAPGGDYGRFDTLFGMRRADLAPSGLYNALGRANVSTVGVRAEVQPGRRSDAFLSYRALWTASRFDSFSTTGVRDASGRSGSFAGHQVEGRVRRWLIDEVLRGEVNAVWLTKQGVLADAPNATRNGDTVYVAVGVMVTL